MTRAIALNRSLVLEALERVPDGLGGFAETWVPRGNLWAEIVPGSGRDLPGEEVIKSAVPLRITVRAARIGAPSRPVAAQRFREGTRAFRIIAVAERDPGGRYLTCFAREEVVT
jgi:head-tail adaptor